MDTNAKLGGCVAIFVIIILIVMIFGELINACHNVHNQTFTITDKQAVASGKSSKYLVFNDKTTYEVADTWLHWRWDSSDVYGKLKVGKTYTATLQGWRIPFFSMYPNIIDPVEVEAEKKD